MGYLIPGERAAAHFLPRTIRIELPLRRRAVGALADSDGPPGGLTTPTVDLSNKGLPTMTARVTRLLAAVFLLVGGIVHYNLWRGGYRAIPKIGPLFLANFVGSIALAGAVMISRRVSVAFAGIAFAVGSLVALILSRTVGVFGFTETIWNAPALKTLTSEIAAIVTLAIAAAVQLRATHHTALRPALQPVSQRRNP
jgi:hypothetical protein